MPGKKKYTLGQTGQSGLHDVTLPSGATCQARRPGVQGLIAAGLLDNFDQLTALVQTEHIDPKNPRKAAAAKKVTASDIPEAAMAVMRDPELMLTGFHLMDKLAAYIVVQPPVWIDYQGKEESDEDWERRQREALQLEAVAVRTIDPDDKMFLMSFATGGSQDLAGFRQGTSELLGNLAP